MKNPYSINVIGLSATETEYFSFNKRTGWKKKYKRSISRQKPVYY